MWDALKDMWKDQQAIGDAKHEAFMRHPVLYTIGIFVVAAVAVWISESIKKRKGL